RLHERLRPFEELYKQRGSLPADADREYRGLFDRLLQLSEATRGGDPGERLAATWLEGMLPRLPLDLMQARWMVRQFGDVWQLPPDLVNALLAKERDQHPDRAQATYDRFGATISLRRTNQFEIDLTAG